LSEQVLAGLERHDRVDARVHTLDLAEIRLHHLDARDLPRLDRASQRNRIEDDDFIQLMGHGYPNSERLRPFYCAQEFRYCKSFQSHLENSFAEP
jgi:hypothetical protein